MIRIQGYRRSVAERGVAVPLLAVLSLALVAIVAVLAFDTTRVKSESSLLRRRLEAVCRSTARLAVTPERAMKVFQLNIGGLRLSGSTKISAARLTLPFPVEGQIDNVLFDTINRPSCQASELGHPPFNPLPNGASEISFGALGALVAPNLDPNPLRCTNERHFENDSIDCTLIPAICSGNTPDPRFPPSMWSDLLNAGNTVGCEIEAQLPALLPFLSARSISARTAWWSPIKPVAPYLEEELSAPSRPAHFAGLSIGIGTEVSTWGGPLPDGAIIGDGRFTFVGMSGELRALDPRGPSEPGTLRRRFDFDSPERPFNGQFSVPKLLGIAPPNGDTPSQHELLAACFNPLTLARNLLVSTLVEYASRSGQTRTMTEIAHINPRHFGDDAPPNRPVVMVPFGGDLLSPRYQAPFVTYNSGGRFDKGGFIVPWNNFGSNETLTNHHALIAQQLRACYHLFIDNATSTTIPRTPISIDGTYEALVPPLLRFQTSSLHTAGVPTNWDYSAPFQSGVPTGNGRLLTASELIYSLGSTQSCPIDYTAGDIFTSNNCSKEALQPFDDLTPDLVGYLEYQLYGGNRAYPSPGLSLPTAGGKAIYPVGGGEDQPDLSSPQSALTPSSTAMPRSVVVIVVHKPLAAQYVPRVAELVQGLNAQNRPVILIFMPSTFNDSTLFANYCEALNLGFDCSKEGETSRNSLVFLSPFNAEYGERYVRNPDGSPRAEGEVFARYWEDLLTDNPGYIEDQYYLHIARNVYLNSIVRLEPKL